MSKSYAAATMKKSLSHGMSLAYVKKKSTRRKIANKFAEANCVCIKIDKHKAILDTHTQSLIVMLFILSPTTIQIFPHFSRVAFDVVPLEITCLLLLDNMLDYILHLYNLHNIVLFITCRNFLIILLKGGR